MVGILRVELSISALRSSRESPHGPGSPTPGLRVEVPKLAARRALVDVDPSLDDRHTALV